MTRNEEKQYQAILEEIDDPDKAKMLYLRWKCLTDLYFLGTKIFNWESARYGNRRKVIYAPLHRWMAGLIEKEEDKLIIVFRKALKTTWIKCGIVRSVLKYPNRRRGLFSSTPRLVEHALADIAINRSLEKPIKDVDNIIRTVKHSRTLPLSVIKEKKP